MESKKKLAQSCRIDNSNFLYSDNSQNQNKNYPNRASQTYIQESNPNKNLSQSLLVNPNYSKQKSPQDLAKSHAITINNDNISTFTFGNNQRQNLSSSKNVASSTLLSRSQNINKEALSFEDSNILNSSRFDLTSSIVIKKENHLVTKSPYVAFSNNYGDNSCYVNVVLHLLYNIIDLNNIFKDFYKIDEIQQQSIIKLKNSNKNINTNLNSSNRNINDNINTALNKSNKKVILQQSATFPTVGINELFIQIGEILSWYEIYLNEMNTVKQVTVLETKKMRESLEKISNGLFPLNYVADPVELFIYILDKLNTNYQRETHNNFHMELIEKAVCRKNCPNSIKNKYDKDNFLYHIYVQELINYIKDNALKFKDTKGNLFRLSYSLYTEEKRVCEKCTLLMEKFLLCLNIPKYLFINCVWKNAVPEIKEIIDFLFLLSLKEDINNLFICEDTNYKNTSYNLLGMILYSYTLCHYTVLIFNKKQKVFALYNDNIVKEFKTLYDVFPEMLIENINLYDNERAYFYPVMLIYTQEKIYHSDDIKNNNLDEKKYNNLLYKVEENQINFIQKHTLSEEQKQKNLQELISKQRELEQEKYNKNPNKRDYNDYYKNDFDNLNINELMNKKNKENVMKNNNKNVSEQLNNKKNSNLEASQRLNVKNNYFNYEEKEDNNKLARTQILSNKINFEDLNKRNNIKVKQNNNNNNISKNEQKVNTQLLNSKINSNQQKNITLNSSQQVNINNKNYPSGGYEYSLNNNSILSNGQYDLSKANRPILSNSVYDIKPGNSYTNNINLNNNQYTPILSNSQYDLSKINRQILSNSVYDIKPANSYSNNINLNNNQNTKGKAKIITNNNNQKNSQSNTRINYNNNYSYNNNQGILNNQYNKGTIVYTSNRPNLAQSQLYSISGNNNRFDLPNTQINKNNYNRNILAQSHYNIGDNKK